MYIRLIVEVKLKVSKYDQISESFVLNNLIRGVYQYKFTVKKKRFPTGQVYPISAIALKRYYARFAFTRAGISYL